MKKKSLSMNQIMILSLTAIVVGILGCAIAFFLRTYQQSLIRNAQTDGRRTISQVTSTVDSYLGDMNNVMEILASEAGHAVGGPGAFFRYLSENPPRCRRRDHLRRDGASDELLQPGS